MDDNEQDDIQEDLYPFDDEVDNGQNFKDTPEEIEAGDIRCVRCNTTTRADNGSWACDACLGR